MAYSLEEIREDVRRAPRGVLGFAQVVADQTGVTSTTDLTGLSVTVNVDEGRRIRVSAKIDTLVDTVSDSTCTLHIREGTTTLVLGRNRPVGNSRSATIETSVVLEPSAGSHTYKLSLQREVGTGNAALEAASNNPAHILVEDIGAA